MSKADARKKRRIAVMLDLQWPHKRHTEVFAGVQRYSHEQDGRWECVVDEYAHDTLPRRKTANSPYDGVIARATRELAERGRRVGVPIANVWLGSPAKNVPSVFADFAAMGRLRAEHLLARGFRRFGCLISRGDRGHQRESEEFCRAVADAGFPCSLVKIAVHYSQTLSQWRKTRATIEEWMDSWVSPIGVFVGPEEIGRQTAQMCHNRRLRVPHDVAIISGYDEEAICTNPAPALTSMDVGYERIGYEAARMIDRMIDGKSPPKTPRLIPPLGIVARESTDFFAVEDATVSTALRFIASNGHRQIGVDDVVRAVGTSRRALEYRFRDHLGRPIAAEIRRLRIERAKRQLAETDRPVHVIAIDAGFGDSKRLCETFRREVGVSPSEYRRGLNETSAGT